MLRLRSDRWSSAFSALQARIEAPRGERKRLSDDRGERWGDSRDHRDYEGGHASRRISGQMISTLIRVRAPSFTGRDGARWHTENHPPSSGGVITALPAYRSVR
jgi:hypothetical protein